MAVEEVARGRDAPLRHRRPGRRGRPVRRSPGSSRSRAPGTAPSRLAIAGRYAATPALLDALRETPRDSGGEVQLSDALSALDAVVALRLAPGEERLDVGTVPGYCAAFVEHALSDAELGPGLRARAATLLDGRR